MIRESSARVNKRTVRRALAGMYGEIYPGGDMKEYAEWFYSSKVWKRCRAEYAKSVGGLCEECLKNGKVTAGVIVHHKVHINPNNIHDPSITLNPDNLVLLCRECHEHEHRRMKKRYKVRDDGTVCAIAE